MSSADKCICCVLDIILDLQPLFGNSLRCQLVLHNVVHVMPFPIYDGTHSMDTEITKKHDSAALICQVVNFISFLKHSKLIIVSTNLMDSF
jgi:hypothetical protein